MKNVRNLSLMAILLVFVGGQRVVASDAAPSGSRHDSNVGSLDHRGNSNLHLIAHAGNIDELNRELARLGSSLSSVLVLKNRDGDTALHRAVFQGKAEIVDALLHAIREQDIVEEVLWVKNNEGRTALHVATIEGWIEIFTALLGVVRTKYGAKKVAKYLDCKDRNGQGALNYIFDSDLALAFKDVADRNKRFF